MPGSQRDDQIAMKHASGLDVTINPPFEPREKTSTSRSISVASCRLTWGKLYAERRRHSLDCAPLADSDRHGGIANDGDPCHDLARSP